jgi:murein L,D-transpeptidase YcbB/YkuD
MKKLLLLLLIHTAVFAEMADPRLVSYQQKYSVCHGKTDYQISKCILNGDLNYARLRGDRSVFRTISTSRIRKAAQEGRAYEFTMEHLPKTKRYIGLVKYLDYLYGVKGAYVTPRFIGDEDDDIMKMKRLFNLLLLTDMEETPERTPQFEEAVLAFQRTHGLAVDGKIGPRTKRALQTPIRQIIMKIKKNLTIERITKAKPSEYILVNIPEFRMHYYKDGEEILGMKVVVGKPKMRTPIFTRKMKFIVLNPTWNVPPSIYAKEYAHKSPAQLRKLGLHYGDNGKLYQPAGRRNALGLVKFLFPNKFNVYMHDTPAKSLFQRSRRAYSHGCIRLEKPMDLLHKLGYSYRPGKTTWKSLEREIPVFVEYHTVWVDNEGVVQFRPDIYGYEKKLFSKPVRRAAPKAKRVKKKDVLSDF